MKWIDSPEAYYLTTGERESWQRITTKKAADEFIAEYWRIRGPRFKSEVMSRIEFADTQFELAGTAGARTARGRVWMLLGSPSEQRVERQTGGRGGSTGVDDRALTQPGGIGGLSRNDIERQAVMTTVWQYRGDRLPPELGMPELTVRFVTDVSRGYEVIENPGLVEPYLRRAAELFSSRGALPPVTRADYATPPSSGDGMQQPGDAGAPGPSSDPLWMVDSSPNKTVLTGEAYISPTDQPFYAINMFVPKDAAPLANLTSVLFVGLVRDAQGRQVINDRQLLELTAYGNGDRYFDRAFALDPGRYEAQFFLFSPDGSTILANHRAELNVPPLAEPRLARVLLTSNIANLEKQGANDPFVFLATKYAVRGDRKFRASDRIGYVTVLANPAASPEPALTQKMIFTRDGERFASTPIEAVPLVRTGPKTWLIGNQFDPDTFKPGHYTLELQIRDTISGKLYVEKAEFDVLP
ncbi:MAG TPA: GWxTD domain-containing protein [Thermoanaerobaculia bacterium]